MGGGGKAFILLTAIAAAFAFSSCSNDSGSDGSNTITLSDVKAVKSSDLVAAGINFDSFYANIPYVEAFESLPVQDMQNLSVSTSWKTGETVCIIFTNGFKHHTPETDIHEWCFYDDSGNKSNVLSYSYVIK